MALENNAVTYPDYFGEGIHLVYTPTANGVKEDIVLDAYTGVNSFTFMLNTRGLNLYQANGRYFLAPGKGSELRFDLGDIVSFDAKGRFSIGTMTAETVSVGNLYRLTITVDKAFLTDENTAYPVSIDPTIDISDNTHGAGTITDATIYQGSPYLNTGGWQYMHCGYYDSAYQVGRVAYNLPGLLFNTTLSGDNIISAVFHVGEATGSAGVAVKLHVINYNWTEDSITWNSHSNSYSSYVQATAYPSYNNFASYDITNIVTDWLTGDLPEYGFMLVSSNETSIDKAFYSSEYSSTAYRPYVAVTHTGGQVDPSIPPEPIPDPALNYDQIDVDVGSTAILSVENLPDNASFTWSSSDSSVATVSSSGVVVGRQAGTATITANISGYGTLTCTVLVTIPDGVYYIGGRVSHHIIVEDKYYQYFVDIENFDTNGLENDAYIELMPFDGGISQKWQITHLGDGVYTISVANISTAYYLGVVAAGYSNTDAVLKTGGVADNVKWKIAPTSSGAYKLIAFSGAAEITGNSDLVLGVDSDSDELPSGYNLCQTYYADNTVYSDEWNLLPVGNDACLVGIFDNGHDHTSVFGNISDELLALGYVNFNTICTSSISRAAVQNAMENCRIFISRSHGYYEDDNTYIVLDNANDIRLSTSHLYDFDNHTVVTDLSNCDLTLFGACYTGATPGYSLPDAAVAAGADYAIGFKDEVNCVLESKWVEYFIQNLATKSVPTAARDASTSLGVNHDTFCYIVSQ